MSDMKDHVPDLERCKRLKEKGFPQETVFVWALDEIKSEDPAHPQNEWYCITRHTAFVEEIEGYPYYRTIAAPIVTELVGEIEKFKPGTNIEMGRYVLADGEDATWECSLDYEAVASAPTLPNALADLWLWLKERGGE